MFTKSRRPLDYVVRAFNLPRIGAVVTSSSSILRAGGTLIVGQNDRENNVSFCDVTPTTTRDRDEDEQVPQR